TTRTTACRRKALLSMSEPDGDPGTAMRGDDPRLGRPSEQVERSAGGQRDATCGEPRDREPAVALRRAVELVVARILGRVPLARAGAQRVALVEIDADAMARVQAAGDGDRPDGHARDRDPAARSKRIGRWRRMRFDPDCGRWRRWRRWRFDRLLRVRARR